MKRKVSKTSLHYNFNAELVKKCYPEIYNSVRTHTLQAVKEIIEAKIKSLPYRGNIHPSISDGINRELNRILTAINKLQ